MSEQSTARAGRRRPRSRLGRAAVALLVLLAVLGALPQPARAAGSGGLTLHFRDVDGRTVTGACYQLHEPDGTTPVVDTCNLSGDTTITLPTGEYRLTETTPPQLLVLDDGTNEQHVYLRAAERNVRVTTGWVAEVTLAHPIGARLEVSALLPDGRFAAGSCFDAVSGVGNATVPSDAACATNGPALLYVPEGPWRVRQVSGPSGASLAADGGVVTGVDQVHEVTLQMTEGAVVKVVQEDDAGNRIVGGCYVLVDDAGDQWASRCDHDDDLRDGIVQLVFVEPGGYDLVEDVAPDGYWPSTDTRISVVGTSTQTVVRPHVPLPEVEVVTTDAAGQELPGSCWQVVDPEINEGWVDRRCDGDDGADDGTTRFVLPPADYALAHESGPAGYARASDAIPFTADADGETVTVVLRSLTPKPSVEQPPSVSSPAVVGDAINGYPGVWRNEPDRYTYQWYSCDAAGEGCTPVAEATEHYYFVAPEHEGRTLRFFVTAHNAGGSSSAMSAPSEVVTTAGPTVLSPPRALRVFGRWFVGWPGRWEGQGRVDRAFQWLRCDQWGDDCRRIPGAESYGYRASAADVGGTLRFRVTARDDTGYAVVDSAPVPVRR